MEKITNINIVDSLMGTGKSTWAIKYINENPDKHFLCVLPTLSECARFKENIFADTVEPQNWGTKRNHFNHLLKNDKSIVTTHELIRNLDLDSLELLKSKDYILIIDECLNVLEPYNISKSDINGLFKQELVSLDNFGFLVWNHNIDYQGRFDDVKRLCEMRSLMGFHKEGRSETAKMLIWNFPTQFFRCFCESYILTYLWDASIQKCYFDIHEIEYTKYMVSDKKELIPYDLLLEYERRSHIVPLIQIYQGRLNEIGCKIGNKNPLSKVWYQTKVVKNETAILDQLRKNTENFFRTVSRTDAYDNMWTTFDAYKKKLKGRGYAKGFVACNARGTNDYRDKKSLAYLVNFNLNPEMEWFIKYYHVDFNKDIYSLSGLLQWIWRSQIRDGKPIHLYVPSSRMRSILEDWMKECNHLSKTA